MDVVGSEEQRAGYVYLCEFYDSSQLYIPLMNSTAILNDKVSGGDVSNEKSPRSGAGVCSALANKFPSEYSCMIVHTVSPSMRSENDKHSVQSYPNKRCAHSQTDGQHNVNPVSLRWRINEIGNDPWWRFQTGSKEHCLCCRCHRLRCRVGILRHSDRMGDIEALVFSQADRKLGRRDSHSYMRFKRPKPVSCGVPD